MKPIAVIPMHDPTGVMFSQLETIKPALKKIFSQVFASVTAVTQRALPDSVTDLIEDSFFHVVTHESDISVGEDFLTLYDMAASTCRPNQILHLCFIDRVAYALQSHHQATFIADVNAVKAEHTPLIFARSELAWQTHPFNYRTLEQMATRTGELLFGKSLDFVWCHLAIQAERLQQIIPHIKRRDLSILSEFTLILRDELRTKDVNWLAWEDPFILSLDPEQLKAEREQSVDETRKRLAYVIPTLQLLLASSSPRDRNIPRSIKG